jgi:L-lactate dehydrogenase complex protein LldG
VSAREKILSRIKANQPQELEETPVRIDITNAFDAVTKFRETLVAIGGSVVEVQNESEIMGRLAALLPPKGDANVIGTDHHEKPQHPHTLQNTDVAIIRGEFAVAENGAIWITDPGLIDRALPFICVHLAVIVRKSTIVPTMHEAYDQIGNANHEFGTFIAGPSKTADIEQSLVLGAHGAKTMTCFLIE